MMNKKNKLAISLLLILIVFSVVNVLIFFITDNDRNVFQYISVALSIIGIIFWIAAFCVFYISKKRNRRQNH